MGPTAEAAHRDGVDDLPAATGWSRVWQLDLEDLVRVACAPMHEVVATEADDLWVMALGPEPLAAQGWKLHVSATVASAEAVLGAVLPVLSRHRVSFKVIRRPSDLQALNTGQLGNSQVGKLVAVYPGDDASAVALARDLTAATVGMAGPRVPSDVPIAGGLVHYRYGAFAPRTVRLPSGVVHPAIAGPDGALVADVRSRRRARPGWVADPFEAAGLVDERSTDRHLVGGRYLRVRRLSASARGEVWLGVDVEGGGPVVTKSARRHSAASVSGRDALDRSVTEGALLELLHGTGTAPGHLATVVGDDEAWVVMEWVDGRALTDVLADAVLAGATIEAARIARWLGSVVDAVDHLHRAGWTYRDLKLANVLVTGDRAVLIDFDLAARVGDDSEDAMGGTRGHMPPELSTRHPADPASDVYGLGAVLHGLLTGTDPALAPDPSDLTTRPIAALAPGADPDLSALCVRCLAAEPAARPSTAEIRAVLDAVRSGRRAGPAAPSPTRGPAIGPDEGRDLARRLVDTLVADGPERWGAPDPMAGGAPVLDVYAGLAGVVLAVAEAVRVDGDPTHRDALVRGAEQLRAAAVGAPDDASPPPGLHTGVAGIAVALVGAAEALGEPSHRDVASAWLLAQAHRCDAEQLVAHAGPDLMVGAAGVARAHLALWRRGASEEHLRRATEVAEVLVATAERVATGVRWRLPDAVPVLGGAAAFGYGHGAAGIADVLFDLADATGGDGVEETAMGASAWVAAAAVPFGPDGVDWGRTDQLEGIAPHWCHGAAGIAPVLARGARRARRRGDPRHAELEATARRAGVATAALRGTGPTLCHGLAGNIWCLRRLGRELGEEPMDHDAHLALLRAHLVEDVDGLRSVGDVPDQTPSGLMTGGAGVALALLTATPATAGVVL